MNDLAEAAARRRAEGRRGDFDAALRRADAKRGDGAQAEARRAAGRVEGRRAEASARGEGQAGGGGAAGGGVTGAPGAPAAVVERGEPWAVGAQPLVAPRVGAAGAGGPEAPAEPDHAALVEAVRALPPVIEAFGASGREVLTLAFAGAIGVELRQASGGVEVGLSVPAALRPAARLELAAICTALAARGVTVVSAEVRGGVPDRSRRR